MSKLRVILPTLNSPGRASNTSATKQQDGQNGAKREKKALPSTARLPVVTPGLSSSLYSVRQSTGKDPPDSPRERDDNDTANPLTDTTKVKPSGFLPNVIRRMSVKQNNKKVAVEDIPDPMPSGTVGPKAQPPCGKLRANRLHHSKAVSREHEKKPSPVLTPFHTIKIDSCQYKLGLPSSLHLYKESDSFSVVNLSLSPNKFLNVTGEQEISAKESVAKDHTRQNTTIQRARYLAWINMKREISNSNTSLSAIINQLRLSSRNFKNTFEKDTDSMHRRKKQYSHHILHRNITDVGRIQATPSKASLTTSSNSSSSIGSNNGSRQTTSPRPGIAHRISLHNLESRHSPAPNNVRDLSFGFISYRNRDSSTEDAACWKQLPPPPLPISSQLYKHASHDSVRARPTAEYGATGGDKEECCYFNDLPPLSKNDSYGAKGSSQSKILQVSSAKLHTIGRTCKNSSNGGGRNRHGVVSGKAIRQNREKDVLYPDPLVGGNYQYQRKLHDLQEKEYHTIRWEKKHSRK